MTKQVIEIDPSLAENLRKAKSVLATAQQEVEDAEAAIYLAVKSHIPEKGTLHVTGCKISTGFYSKWSDDKLTEIERTWVRKSNLPFPFKKVWKEDGKAVSYIRDNAADAYEVLTEALTLTPKKPSFELT
jgi:hypothetical protein